MSIKGPTPSPRFTKIGIMGKPANPEVQSTMATMVHFLQARGIDVCLAKEVAEPLVDLAVSQLSQDEIANDCELIIVVGGDGSFLSAARAVVDANKPMVGVNRGRRGFLTDISPQALTQSLLPILEGHYQEEHRFLLNMTIERNDQAINQSMALNDVVLHSGNIAKMIEFEVWIDNAFVYRQRSDGLITATPTGSTAYALSGGGPILHPKLNAIALVPMHPALLSSRPIVVQDNAHIEIRFCHDNVIHASLSCDGQVHFEIQPGDIITIERKSHELRLLHPNDYDYYHTLRNKLGWHA